MPVDRLYVTQTAHAIANVRMSGRTIGDLPELLTALKVNIHAPRVNYRAGRLEADIANAIAAATDRRAPVRLDAPATPERVLAAIERAR